MLYLIFTQDDHRRAVLLAVHLLVLHLRPAAGAGQHHQHLPRDGGVAARSSRSILQMPKEPKPVQPGAARRSAHARVRPRDVSAPDRPSSPAVTDISFDVAARRDDRVRRAVGRGQDDAREAARRAVSAAVGRHPLQRHLRRRRSTSTSCASASASSRRTRSSSPARSARTCCS